MKNCWNRKAEQSGPPTDASTTSLQGLLHFISGGVGFLALIGACFVFAARFAGLAQRDSWR